MDYYIILLFGADDLAVDGWKLQKTAWILKLLGGPLVR